MFEDSEAGGRQVPTLKIVDGQLVSPCRTEGPEVWLKNRSAWLTQRLNEIVQASARCALIGREIPKEWVCELEWTMREIESAAKLEWTVHGVPR